MVDVGDDGEVADVVHKDKGHVGRGLVRCNILLHSREPRINGVMVQVVVADLPLPVQQHRDLVAPFLLQRRVAVHVHHLDVEVVAALEALQSREELLAEVAILAGQDRELRFHSGSGRKVTKRVPFSSRISSATGFFGSSFTVASLKLFTFVMSTLFTRRITSPGPTPAASAEPSAASTTTPPVIFRVRFCSAVSSITATPSLPGLDSAFFGALPDLSAVLVSSSLNSATVTVRSRALPPRQTLRFTLVPGLSARMVRERSAEPSTLRPSILRITSPTSRPAFPAGEPSSTLLTAAPTARPRPRLSARSLVTFWMPTPMRPRTTLPVFISWSATLKA